MNNPPQDKDGPKGRPAARDRSMTMTTVELRYYEKLRIGNVTIDVAPDQDYQVKVAIDAPRDVVILRQELAGRKPKR